MTHWRTIAEFPAYEVSVAGAVRRAIDGRQMSPRPDGTGYVRVTFASPGVKKYRYVHRLVALAFSGKAGPGEIVRHLNGDRLDNRADNLAYGTHADNRQDAIAHGTASNSGPRFTPAERRRNLRLAQNMTTAELVEAIGVSKTYARRLRQQARGA